MLFIDTHMHSSISHDSHFTRLEMARGALTRGLAAICFTDHYDLVDFDGSLQLDFDWEKPRAQQREAREYCGDRLTLRYGVELGNAPADFSAAEHVLAKEPNLDFVIASIHNLSVESGGGDLYNCRYDSPELCYTYLDDYFRQMLAVARWGQYDVLGHIPYPMRYMRDRDGQQVTLDRYEGVLREILTLTIDGGRGIEVNTKMFPHQIYRDYARLLTLYRELGGELVTVGADAHRPQDIGFGIPDAYQLMKQLGYRYVALYERRVPRMIAL